MASVERRQRRPRPSSRVGEGKGDHEAPVADEDSDDQTAARGEAQADKLVCLALAQDIELFRDPTGAAWSRIKIDDHHEIWSCEGRQFKLWLARLYWQTFNKAINSQVITAALNVLVSKGIFDGAEHELHNRVARDDGAIWYDLADAAWRVVRITSSGWKIVPDSPIRFRRFAHQAAQVIPVGGGDLHRLLDFMNLKDPGQRLLLLVDLVFCFVPGVPHPISVSYGPQGSAKTTASRMRRGLVDPSVAETLSFPANTAELVQTIAHHWMPIFDNITTLPDWASDVLCRASTGEGSSKRVLYSDDDDLIYRYKRCCGLNGINISAQKPDLLDRCLLFQFESIPAGRRRPEEQLWADYERERPMLVGAALTVLSRAMAIRPTVRLDSLHRMADFMLWGCAIAEALGYSRSTFLQAIDRNVTDRNEEVLANNPVASMIIALMERREEWEGTPSALLAELKGLADANFIDTRSKLWPRAPQVLSRRINEIRPNLDAVGIKASGGGGRRGIRLFKCPENTVRSVHTVKEPAIPGESAGGISGAVAVLDGRQGRGAPGPDGTDGVDGISGTSKYDYDLSPCPRCKGTKFYMREGDTVTCAACVPPLGSDHVAWIDCGNEDAT